MENITKQQQEQIEQEQNKLKVIHQEGQKKLKDLQLVLSNTSNETKDYIKEINKIYEKKHSQLSTMEKRLLKNHKDIDFIDDLKLVVNNVKIEVELNTKKFEDFNKYFNTLIAINKSLRKDTDIIKKDMETIKDQNEKILNYINKQDKKVLKPSLFSRIFGGNK